MPNILGDMIELLQYNFFSNALLVGILSGIACGVIGSFVVIKKISFISGSIAHASFGGIGIAYFFGFNPILGAILFSIASALAIGFINKKNKLQEDASIGAIWAIGMAVGLIFIYFTRGYAADLMSYLFGNILFSNQRDILYILALDLFIVASVCFLFKWLVAIIFDEEFSVITNIKVFPLYLFLLVLIALSVVVLIKSVGVILVIALLCLPASAARLLSNNFRNIILIACAIAVFSNIAGIIISYYLNIPSGPVIVLTAAFVYIFILLGTKLKKC
ncbi:MAG: metal ABC transporter permease [bacterium]